MSIRKKIAILIGEAETEYQERFISGFLAQAFQYDYDVCVFAMYQKCRESFAREVGESSIFALVEYNRFDAVVLMSDTIQTNGLVRELEERLKKQFKGVVLCVDAESQYFPYIEIDYYESSKQIISHLIEHHGFSDIAYLTGYPDHKHSVQRLQGFTDCMKEHGIAVGNGRISYGDYWYSGGEQFAKRILKQGGNMPQAIACANDYMAIGIAKILSEHGIRVPEDIVIVGYDSVSEGRTSSKPITSVSIPTLKYGEYAANCVKALLNGMEVPVFEYKPELYVGSSCGCCVHRIDSEIQHRERWYTDASKSEFFSPQNHMREDLLCQTTFYDLMHVIDYYVYHIRDFDSFHICLNEDWNDFEKKAEEGRKDEIFSKRMLDVLQCGSRNHAQDTISFDTYFDTNIMLPELQEEHSKPRVYFFTPLYFEEKNFGYAVICYQNWARSYTATYRLWLQNVMQELECFRRIETIQRSKQQLEDNMVHETLTGMYNYNGFLKQKDQIMRDVFRTGSYVGTLAIDIKDLMKINEAYGRGEGDKTIIMVANILNDVFPNGTRICFGNGEMVVILLSNGVVMEELQKGYNDIVTLISEYVKAADIKYSVQLHYGIEFGLPCNADELERIVNVAISKKNGSKAYKQKMKQIHNLTQEEYDEAQIVQILLDENRFHYNFQPIVNAKTGDIFAYEALMRPDVDPYMSPLTVLKYAEYYDRLYEVEKATFFNVLDIVGKNREIFDGSVKVFINSIPGNLLYGEDATRLETIAQSLPDTVVVELTEQVEATDDELSTLKGYYNKIGFQTAIDDYGTGYSNITNLLRYMPNCVKIDRMLLADIQESPQKQHFVKDIISFSHDNNITVLAEGVETQEELQMVIHLGVDLIQGYYTAKPSKEIVLSLSRDIKNEIVEINKKERHNKGRRVYEVGKESQISLAQLEAQKYSVIEIADREATCPDVTINGVPDMETDMYIRVKGGYRGRIILNNVALQGKKHGACVDIGNDCDVTIVLCGDNSCYNGGIRVPSSSKMTMEGEGHLNITVDAANYFGIGNDLNADHGKLVFMQSGTIEIKGSGMKGVGIGSGLGGEILVLSGKYVIHLVGQEAVGIGSYDGDIAPVIKECDMKIITSTAKAVGVGSMDGNVHLRMSSLCWIGEFNTDNVVGLGTVDGEESDIEISSANVMINIHAKKVCGIGAHNKNSSLTVTDSAVVVTGRGTDAIAWGSLKGQAQVKIREAKLESQLDTKLNTDIGVDEKDISIERGECIYMVNGEKQIHRVD